MIALPKAVVVFPDAQKPDLVERLVSGLKAALPDLTVQVGGKAPPTPYAVIEFVPDDMTAYLDTDWVHISGAGANGMLAALRRDNIHPKLITRTVGAMGAQIGEYVLSYVLADAQKHAARAVLQRDKIWDARCARPDRVAGQSALIIGTGGIGAGVANVLRAVGMKTIGVSRSGRAQAGFDRVMAMNLLPTQLAEIDLCVAALPLTDATRHGVNRDIFARFDSAMFVNVGRGATMDLADLKTALAKGYLRRAVLDVVPAEPLSPDSDLWNHPQITITPHISGLTQPEDTVDAFVRAYEAIKAGQTPELCVDPAAGY